jgi:hypothetical protein
LVSTASDWLLVLAELGEALCLAALRWFSKAKRSKQKSTVAAIIQVLVLDTFMTLLREKLLCITKRFYPFFSVNVAVALAENVVFSLYSSASELCSWLGIAHKKAGLARSPAFNLWSETLKS